MSSKSHKSYRSHLAFGLISAAIAAIVIAPMFITTRRVHAVSASIVISQVYGGGGNGGSTYRNDFIELFNRGTAPVSVAGWSVQYASAAATSAWQVTNLIGVTIQPGQYYLVQEAQGAGGTTNLPTPDATGTIAMSATAANIALVNSTTALATGCPAAASVVDLVGYGSTAACRETSPTTTLTNTTAALRNNNGCTETDNNSSDFTAGAPNPRNTASLQNPCGGAGAPTITNTSPLPNGTVGAAYSVTFTASGGSGTGYTFAQTGGTLPPGLTLSGGVLSGMPNTTTGSPFSFTIQVTDSASATGSKVFQLTVNAPAACPASSPVPQSCGVERWSVKTGTDADVGLVNLNSATPTTISALHALPSPNPIPANNRVAPGETTQWVIQGTLVRYKLESDSDYHVVIQDGPGNVCPPATTGCAVTIVTEIPYPGNTPSCVTSASALFNGITTARCEFDSSSLPLATTSFQTVSVPVRIIGVGMFDFAHGQTGASPNQIEIHPILDIAFPTTTNAATGAGANVNVQLADVSVTFANVSGGGTTTSTPIDPSTAGPPLAGYNLVGPAFNLTTTATSTGPYNICISVPYITNPSSFSMLKLLHFNGATLDDITTGQNSVAKVVCGSAPTLSPFVVALGLSPTAADGNVGGQIVDDAGDPVAGVAVRMSGAQNRLTITDPAGFYHFDNVETNAFYTITPSRANFTFSPAQRSFSQLGLRTEAAFTATSAAAGLNPLDTTEYFVRQQYLDFLGREPDEAGFNFWVNNIDGCGEDSLCREAKRIDTSAAFFLSIEFQHTGYLVYRMYQTAFGDLPGRPVPLTLAEFRPDTRTIGRGVIVKQTGWEQALENNKRAFAEEFVRRARFVLAYETRLTPAEFVDQLFARAGITPLPLERAAAISEFGPAANTTDVEARARALRRVAENSELSRQKFNQAFVLMQYFGYLGRDANSGPDTDFTGYNFWLNKLNNFDGNYQDAEMVRAFLMSSEYRGRFPR